MEDDGCGILKDEKPYFILRCSKCEQYMYVTPSQKRKKCLRCGRTHTVDKLEVVEEVKGMTAAVERVKELQNTLGDKPILSGAGEFSIASFNARLKKTNYITKESELEAQFYDLLRNLTRKYTKFPYYMIELMAEEYRFDKSKLGSLLHQFIKKGIIKCTEENYYTLLM